MRSDIELIKVYTKPNCGACIATKTTMTNHGLPFETVDISKVEGEAQRLVDAGFRSMPVVEVVYDTGDTDVWTGFKAENIYALTGKTGA